MDEILSLIRTLAEQVLDDPPDVSLVTQSRDFMKQEQTLTEPKPPTYKAVMPVEALTPTRYTYQTAETSTPVYDRKPSAEPTLTERVGKLVLDVAQNQPSKGVDAVVTEPMRIAGMSATVALQEKMQSSSAAPAEKIISHYHQASPDLSVKHFIPNTPDTDFVGMFREFDSKVRLPSFDFTPAGPLPPTAVFSPVRDVISSEEYSSRSLQQVLTQDDELDRLVYP